MSRARQRRYAVRWARYQKQCDQIGGASAGPRYLSPVAATRGWSLAVYGVHFGRLYAEFRSGGRTYYGRPGVRL